MIKLFEPDYRAYQIFLKPGDLGHAGIRRPRTFIYLAHQVECEYLYDLYAVLEKIKQKISNNVRTTPRDYLVSTPAAKHLVNAEMARKRKLQHDADTSVGGVILKQNLIYA